MYGKTKRLSDEKALTILGTKIDELRMSDRSYKIERQLRRRGMIDRQTGSKLLIKGHIVDLDRCDSSNCD